VVAGAPAALAVRIGVAPTLLGFGLQLALLRTEHLEHRFVGHRLASLVGSDRLVDCRDHVVQPLCLCHQQVALGPQRLAAVEVGTAQQLLDVVEREPELAVEQHQLESFEIIWGVEPIASLGPPCGHDEADLVVVMQRPDRHPCERGAR
jgi:hypothetical protein